MREKTIGTIIAVTYTALLGVWLATLRPARRAFSRQPVAGGATAGAPPERSAEPVTVAGTLLVFVANILTMGLFVGGLFSSRLAARLPGLRLPLPRAVNVLGACLFALGGAWGVLVMIYNPGYTPFFLRPAEDARLATRGPYAVVRHPRYSAEAALNVILAAFTGAWLPLLGLLGWPAMRRQARREEEDLLRVAPTAYAEYASRTGAFLPRIPGTRARRFPE
jgi:protein-S-isoprenylcysteine O-methyltransferase Ste14